MHSCKITAHRGASTLAPENTMAAFLKAKEVGADTIELDVRKTRDGQIVVIHDADYKGRLVRELNFSQLREMSGGQVPLLEEVLKFAAENIPLEIELKEAGYEAEVADLVLQHLDTSEFRVISFYRDALKEIKRKSPSIQTGLLIGSRGFNEYRKFFQAIGGQDSDYDCLNLFYGYWKSGLIRFLPFSEKKIFLWTLDSKNLAAEIFKDERVAGITTNIPAEMLALRDRD